MDRHIIAIGGGGFGRSPGDMKIEKYIISLSNAQKPNICFIPTASGDNDLYKLNFYQVFTKLDCTPTHIDFFKRTIGLEQHINKQDIIYVGGGNTKSMLAIWRDWGLDVIIKKAYQKGVIMSGVSAGAICWFSKGITDSWQNDLSIIDCLDLIKGNCCPHFDEEPCREPYVNSIVKEGVIEDCIAIEGCSALHVKNEQPFQNISFGKHNKNSYKISLHDEILSRKSYESISL